MLVDSSVLIELERRALRLSDLREDPDELWTMSAITVSELQFGLRRAVTEAQRSRRERFLAEMLDQLPVMAFDLAVASTHSRIWAELTARGQRIGAHDFLIAATAIAHEFDVLTENVREFSRVPGLTVRQPNW